MKKIQRYDQLPRVTKIPDAGTVGAVVGKDLRWPDGTVVQEGQIRQPATGGSTGNAATTLWRLVREIPQNIQRLAELASVGFTTRDADGNWLQRSIGEGVGIDVQNGDGVAGNPVVSLEDLPDSGTGAALRKITRDAKGRVSGTSAATTTDLPEGTNQYFTTERGQDAAGSAIAAGTFDGLTLTYDDAGNRINGANTDKGSTAVAAHIAQADPHPQYTTAAEASAAAPVQSVNGQVGTVSITTSSIGAATAAQGAKADSAVQEVRAGTNVSIDNTDPRRPIVSASGGGGGAVSSVNARTGAVAVPDFASKATAPTATDYGRALINGDRWRNTGNGVLYTYQDGAWLYDNAASLSRYVPARLSNGNASPIPLNADGTIPAKLADGTQSNIPTQA